MSRRYPSDDVIRRINVRSLLDELSLNIYVAQGLVHAQHENPVPMVGSTLSHYRIVEELGRGGMGIVYKAEDTKLERTVAIKVLPAAALSNGDDRARFYREARAAAALNHPHIAAIHEIDEATPRVARKITRSEIDEATPRVARKITRSEIDEAIPEDASSEDLRPFIAMEFIEGGTLDERIKQGPLKLKEAVRIAIQVADALKAAHAKEIVHRDIKSVNIMLTQDGQAKVLDFGLAQTAASTKLTRMGSTLGTVAYMSPEQARGEEVDSRTDLYSLGAVVYEMICGRAPYGGEYEQAIIYSILNADPEPLTALRTGVPMELERLVNKLLSKEPSRRYQTAADLIVDLESVPTEGSGYSSTTAAFSTIGPAATVAAPAPAWQQRYFWGVVAVAALLGAAMGLFGAGIGGGDDSVAPLQRVEITLRGMDDVRFPKISPNGQYLAFRATDMEGQAGIFLRNMSSGSVRYIDNTLLGGRWEYDFSPEGGRIGFTQRLNGGVFTVVVPNGIPERRTEFGRFAFWQDENTIVMNDDRSGGGGGMYRLDLSTNEMTPISIDGPELEEGYGYIVKTHVPGSNRAFGHQLIRERPGSVSGDFRLFTIDLASGKLEWIEPFTINPEFVQGGFLMYQLRDDAGELVVRPVDERTGQFSGQPMTVLDEVTEMNWSRYALSPDGDLLYTTSRGLIGVDPVLWLVHLDDRSSEQVEVVLPEGSIPMDPEFSADDSRIVFYGAGSGLPEIYSYDRNESLQYQITFDDMSFSPTLNADGSSLYFTKRTAEISSIVRLPTDAAPGAEPELVFEGAVWPTVSPDGKWLAATGAQGGETGQGLMLIDLETKEVVWADTSGINSGSASFSPDNRFVAYHTRLQEKTELVVRPILGAARHVIPNIDGDSPSWSADGGFLFFETDAGIERIPVRTTPTFNTLGSPELVLPLLSENGWDISSDGRTVVVSSRSVEMSETVVPEPRIIWYQNWSDHLKREFER